MGGSRLVVFVRYPAAGKVKTRLGPALGDEGAASLYRAMAEHTLKWASRLAAKKADSLEVRFDGAPVEAMAGWLGGGLRYVPQGEGDVGVRMERAFRESFAAGAKKVVLVGTDCPELSLFHVRRAWAALDRHALVLGPTFDGGYCLIGLRKNVPELFRGLTWSTDRVLAETTARALAAGLGLHVLPKLRDVDVPEDLPVWGRSARQQLSVIIPTLDEGAWLEGTLQAVGRPPATEVIVADGGSRDGTLAAAERAGATIVTSRPGRGRQLNAGAAAAAGDIFLFLHADTRLPRDFAALVRRALWEPDVAGGAFALKFEPCPPRLKATEITANWRARLFRLPFGDQAIFVRAPLFRLLGGFPDLPLMEDVEFVRRLGRAGRLAILPAAVRTSSRRFERGVLRTTLLNKVLFAGYLLGVDPARLERIYRRR